MNGISKQAKDFNSCLLDMPKQEEHEKTSTRYK